MLITHLPMDQDNYKDKGRRINTNSDFADENSNVADWRFDADTFARKSPHIHPGIGIKKRSILKNNLVLNQHDIFFLQYSLFF